VSGNFTLEPVFGTIGNFSLFNLESTVRLSERLWYGTALLLWGSGRPQLGFGVCSGQFSHSNPLEQSLDIAADLGRLLFGLNCRLAGSARCGTYILRHADVR
jgi:hypothetical protein